MALTSARPDCPVSSYGADYKAWSWAGQNWKVLVRSAASQPLIRGWLATNWWSVNKVLVDKPFSLNIDRFRLKVLTYQNNSIFSYILLY